MEIIAQVKIKSTTTEDEDHLSLFEATKTLAGASVTCAGGLLCRRTTEIFNYMMLGRLGDPELVSGAGLGNSTISITLIAVGLGMTGAIETLASRAFGRGKNYLAGWYYTRAQVILTLILVPICLLLWYLTPVLIFLGQEVQVSIYAGNYARAMIPGTFMFVQTEALRKFLVAQGQYSFMPKIQLVTAMLHPLWLYINVFCLDLSIEGVAYSTVITHSLNFLVAYIWITIDRSIVKEGSWNFINKDTFTDYFEFLRYGVPNFLTLGLEVWSFQFIHFWAGFLGATQLGASVILINLQTFLFMASLGTSLVASSLIGNNLGASKPKTAYVYIKAIIATVAAITLTFTLGLMVFRHQIAAAFTTSESIHQEIVTGIFVTSLITFPDGLHCALFGVMKAMGYQDYWTPISFVWYWMIAVPTGYYFGDSSRYGLKGLWIGYPISLTLLWIVSLYLILRTDFKKLSQKVIEKLEKQKLERENS